MFATLSLALAATAILDLNALPDDANLGALLWEHAPSLVDERVDIGAAQAQVLRARARPNPQLDLGAGSLPIGATNPEFGGEIDPWRDIPNYTVGLSQEVELGKRGPRVQAASEAANAARLEAAEALRQVWLDAHVLFGRIAAARLRIEALEALTADAAELTRLEEARAASGATAGLDADRARIEHERMEAELEEQRAELLGLVAECARLTGLSCVPFADESQAKAFLRRSTPESNPDDERVDIAALHARERSARALQRLASAQAIPNPTLSFGYMRDQYLLSGNHANSLFVDVSIPLPIFESGKGDLREAHALAEGAALARRLLSTTSSATLDAIRRERDTVEAQRKRLEERSIPLSRRVVDTITAALEKGGATLTELLPARRTLVELVLTASELEERAFELAIERARATGFAPPLPPALADW